MKHCWEKRLWDGTSLLQQFGQKGAQLGLAATTTTTVKKLFARGQGGHGYDTAGGHAGASWQEQDSSQSNPAESRLIKPKQRPKGSQV